MPRIFVGIGSNINREHNVHGALTELESSFGKLTCSDIYESEAVGFKGDDFYNLVVAFDSDLNIDRLKENLDQIEKKYGRTPNNQRFAPRTLDLDLLLYGDWVDQSGKHDIPRKEISKYAFVLLPLSEIAGTNKHPVTGESFSTMWEEFPKDQKLSKINWPSDS